MDDQPGLSEQYRMSSPWPVFVALGLAISELGVLLNVVPVSVGGLLLFTGSIAGIVREAGYTEQPWGTLAGLGVVLVVLGGILIGTQIQSLSALAAIGSELVGANANGILIRGVSIVGAGLIALIVSQVVKYALSDPDAL